MKPKDLVAVSNELNKLLFDAKKKDEGWIDTTGNNVKKMTKGIKEAAAILEAEDELAEETLSTMREIDWSLDDYDKEESKHVQETLQKMGIWLNEEEKEEVVVEAKVEKAPVTKKKTSSKKAPVQKDEDVEEVKSQEESTDKKKKTESATVEVEDKIEEDTQILVLRDNAKAELSQIKTIEGGIEYLHKVQSIATWMQAEKKDAELQNMVAEQKLRTQRILGELIQQGQKDGEIATQSKHGKGIQSSVPQGNTRKTLEDIGISRKQSSTYKQIADIPKKDFDSFIELKKEAVDLAVSELTTKGAIQLSKNLKKKVGKTPVKKEKKESIILKELNSLIQNINTKYTKEQREYIVANIEL